ncbi:hypothetical protein AVEN_4414-1 [Araneus ventricosus]|uniref:Mos1 transposase HTH domain-containing protein n=1 Tax=Araneus ventricosus TaxID=182803 RepID=A0A4Y2VC97_ARAVE|nr:hypothetical protein AVEN_4414-1 [Araneus ventricosus]
MGRLSSQDGLKRREEDLRQKMDVKRDEQYFALSCLSGSIWAKILCIVMSIRKHMGNNTLHCHVYQEAYEETVLPRWFKMFKEERELISKEGGPNAPVTTLTEVNINIAAAIAREDRRTTLRDQSERMNVSSG